MSLLALLMLLDLTSKFLTKVFFCSFKVYNLWHLNKNIRKFKSVYSILCMLCLSDNWTNHLMFSKWIIFPYIQERFIFLKCLNLNRWNLKLTYHSGQTDFTMLFNGVSTFHIVLIKNNVQIIAIRVCCQFYKNIKLSNMHVQ